MRAAIALVCLGLPGVVLPACGEEDPVPSDDAGELPDAVAEGGAGACGELTTCTACLREGACGFCDGVCVAGASGGPDQGTCGTWVYEDPGLCGAPAADGGAPPDLGCTPTADDPPPAVVPHCADADCCGLRVATTEARVGIVRGEPACAGDLVALLTADPLEYLPAFYPLVAAPEATEALFFATYRADWALGPDAIEDLRAHLPAAVEACAPLSRCADWRRFFLEPLERGDLHYCPETECPSEAALLARVPYGGYACIERTAAELRPWASQATVEHLLSLLARHEAAWARRNAARVLGRLAEAPEASKELVRETLAGDVKATILARLDLDLADAVLHESIWIADSFFFPWFETKGRLEAVSGRPAHATELRFRAIAAYARLLQRQPGVITAHDDAFLRGSLASDDLWVRAEAAFIMRSLSRAQTTDDLRAGFVSALEAAYAGEPALEARVEMAKALDALAGGTRATALRSEYEAAHLGTSRSRGAFTIRTSWPAAAADALLERMAWEEAAFHAILGAAFDAPVPEDPNATMTLVLFGTQDEYRAYMGAFVGGGASAGGLYVERAGTLYTYDREPTESIFTVEELVQHELGHYLEGRYVYPGVWGDAGYHREPRAWADEGFAEVLAGLVFDGTGGYTLPVRANQAARLCAPGGARALPSLLAQRAGYSEPGVFDYASGWGFVYYLFTARSEAADRLYRAWRDGAYALDRFAEIAGVASVDLLETDWRAVIATWCATSGHGGVRAEAPPHGPRTGLGHELAR